LAVDSGYWPLFRYDPRRLADGHNPLVLDSPPPKLDLARFLYNETRFRMVESINRERARELLNAAAQDVQKRYRLYEQLAHLHVAGAAEEAHTGAAASKVDAHPAPAASTDGPKRDRVPTASGDGSKDD
jgi:hypothetical protein